MTILIKDNKPISQPFEGGYKVDGKKVTAKELAKQGVIEVDYINAPQPILAENQTATSEWQLTDNGWERVWTIVDVPIIDWLHDYALRIVVPKSLVVTNRDILIYKSYFEVMGLPVEILTEEVHLYCNEILADDLPMIEQLKLQGVVVENKPA